MLEVPQDHLRVHVPDPASQRFSGPWGIRNGLQMLTAWRRHSHNVCNRHGVGKGVTRPQAELSRECPATAEQVVTLFSKTWC